MRPRSLLPAAFALLIALAAVAAVPMVDARAPPSPVCGVCSFDRTTVDGTVVAQGESQLTVTIHENGSTSWDANVELAAGADALVENDSLRQTVVAKYADSGIADPEAVRSRVDGETLHVRYRDPGATEQYAGTVVFTPLTPEGPDHPFAMGGEGSRYLGADRLTVRPAQGYDIHDDADADATDSGALVWTRENGSEQRSLVVEDDPVVVDVDAGAPGIRIWMARLLT